MRQDNWEELFTVVDYTLILRMSRGRVRIIGIAFALYDKITKKVVAEYYDHCYAIKQARYRYKKTMNKVERTLLVE